MDTETRIVDTGKMAEIATQLTELANQVDQTPVFLSEVISRLGYTANYSNATYQFDSLSQQAEIIAKKIRELLEWIVSTTDNVEKVDQQRAEENYEQPTDLGGNGGADTGTSGTSGGGSSGGGGTSGGGSGGGGDTTTPSTPEQPTEPSDTGSGPEQPTAPSAPEQPTQPGGGGGGGGGGGEKPTQPSAPEEPTQPGGGGGGGGGGEQPTQPSAPEEPTQPGGGGGGGSGAADDMKASLADALDKATKQEATDTLKGLSGTGNIADASKISPSMSNKGSTRSISPWALAGLGLAAGSIALGTGLLVKYNSYYTFGPEDWSILSSSIQNTILNDFKEAGFTKEEVETFVNSTFKVKAVDFDKHINNVKRANELDVSLELELNDLYGFSCYDSEGKLIKYALFIMMIIDGKDATDDFNIYNILNTSLDENDMDLTYSGFGLYEYIEDEYSVEEETTETEITTEPPTTTDYFS